jgi:hypothetical protein
VGSIPLNVYLHFQVSCIMDPVDDSVYKSIWMATAKVSAVEILCFFPLFLLSYSS